MMLEMLTIEELAERSGLSIRTIRFYITEGLLPSPQTRGRNSAYTQEALDRLILIQRLKDAHLPLKEIRDQLDALSPARIHELAQQQEMDITDQAVTFDMPAPSASTNSALDYIARVLETRSMYHQSDQPRPHPPAVDKNVLRKPPPFEPAENWQRIEISPGVELHIREPLDPLTRKKLAQIIEMVKIIFRE